MVSFLELRGNCMCSVSCGLNCGAGARASGDENENESVPAFATARVTPAGKASDAQDPPLPPGGV